MLMIVLVRSYEIHPKGASNTNVPTHPKTLEMNQLRALIPESGPENRGHPQPERGKLGLER